MSDKSRVDKPKPVLRLYTRAECHLCDEMKKDLFSIKDDYGFHFEVHDVETLQGGAARYNELVPVLLWGKDVVCYRKLDRKLLARALGVKQ